MLNVFMRPGFVAKNISYEMVDEHDGLNIVFTIGDMEINNEKVYSRSYKSQGDFVVTIMEDGIIKEMGNTRFMAVSHKTGNEQTVYLDRSRMNSCGYARGFFEDLYDKVFVSAQRDMDGIRDKIALDVQAEAELIGIRAIIELAIKTGDKTTFEKVAREFNVKKQLV